MTMTARANLETALTTALRPIQRAMTPQLARALASMRLDRQFQTRLDELAGKNTEGQLTPDESAEYDQLLAVLTFITTMQSKARQKLRPRKPAK